MPTTNLFRRTAFAPAMAALPLTCLDIGARGGIEADLLPLAFACDVIGFEPDEEEFRRLEHATPGPWRSRAYVPAAVADRSGRRALYLATDRQSTTLLEPDPAIGARFDKPQFFTVERRVEVDTIGLDDAVATHAGRGPDYLKIDIEGAEGEVFAAAPRTLASLIAIKTEISFLPFRKGQALAADIDRMLRGDGFELMDYARPAHWRRRGYVIHPLRSPGPVPYARGQIMHGDALYMRSPDSLPAGDDAHDREAGDRLLRACWLLMAHGYFDHAEDLLRRPAAHRRLTADFGIDPALALFAASRLVGRAAWRQALWRQLRGLVPLLRAGLSRTSGRPPGCDGR